MERRPNDPPNRNLDWYYLSGAPTSAINQGSEDGDPDERNSFPMQNKELVKAIANTTSILGQLIEPAVLASWSGQCDLGAIDPVALHSNLNAIRTLTQPLYDVRSTNEELFGFWGQYASGWELTPDGLPVRLIDNSEFRNLLGLVDTMYHTDLEQKFHEWRVSSYPGARMRYLGETTVLLAHEADHPHYDTGRSRRKLLVSDIQVRRHDDGSLLAQFDGIFIYKKNRQRPKPGEGFDFWAHVERGRPWAKLNIKSIFGTAVATGTHRVLRSPRILDVTRFKHKIGKLIVYWHETHGKQKEFTFPSALRLIYLRGYHTNVEHNIVIGTEFLATWLSELVNIVGYDHLSSQQVVDVITVIEAVEKRLNYLRQDAYAYLATRPAIDKTLPLRQPNLINLNGSTGQLTTNPHLANWSSVEPSSKNKSTKVKDSPPKLPNFGPLQPDDEAISE